MQCKCFLLDSYRWLCEIFDLCRVTCLCFSNWQINSEVEFRNPLVPRVSSWLFKAWGSRMSLCPVLHSVFLSVCELASLEFNVFSFEELASLLLFLHPLCVILTEVQCLEGWKLVADTWQLAVRNAAFQIGIWISLLFRQMSWTNVFSFRTAIYFCFPLCSLWSFAGSFSSLHNLPWLVAAQLGSLLPAVVTTLLWDFWGSIQGVVSLKAAWTDINGMLLWAVEALFSLQRCKQPLCSSWPLPSWEITSCNVFLCFQGIVLRVWGGICLAGIVFFSLALEIQSFLHGTDIARVAS